MEEEFQAIGFMFDAEHQKCITQIDVSNEMKISLKSIGNQPGHLQSGQYFWPASIAISKYLLNNWETVHSSKILELGAGCGLAGIVASKLLGPEVVVFTDYDPGCLALIEENVQLNECLALSTRYHYQCLEWGKPISIEERVRCEYPKDGFGLILGSDLIYSIDVVFPLLRTVRELLHSQSGIFVLATSFHLDKNIESKIEEVCQKFCLSREVLVELDELQSVSKIEYYRVNNC